MDKTDSIPVAEWMDLLDSYCELICKNIDYDILLQRQPENHPDQLGRYEH